MYLFGTNQSIEEILSLPGGGYTGILAEGDYSLEDFPEQEQLKQLAKEYWLTRYDQTSDHERPSIRDNVPLQRGKHEFESRQTQTERQLVIEILQEDMKIETILRKLMDEQPGEMPLLSQGGSRDILSLLDPPSDESNAGSPLIRRLKTEQSND